MLAAPLTSTTVQHDGPHQAVQANEMDPGGSEASLIRSRSIMSPRTCITQW